MSERDEIREYLADWQQRNPDGRLFRANSGQAWAGKVLKHAGDLMTLKNPRPFHGMPTGTPDLIGWTTCEITPDMVGLRVPIFTAVEIKTGLVRVTPEQARFIELVKKCGGFGEIVRKN